MNTSVFSLEQEVIDLIEQKFREKQQMAHNREQQLFYVMDEKLTEEELWALKFLFAYMPVNDLADYNGELFLKHVRTTLEIRKQMPWGVRVPDHLFLHFVLPYRVNTENIEDSRSILFNELVERTRTLTMKAAILETNYWCHEKATYIGSDLRTLSPLSMIRNARGRCGEESTLAVAALRSIGIPARQVYTPRWAHCDDNHAWVEAWADGEWYYIGACEPEAQLNQGWFTPPSRRAMLINTRIFANYLGPEDITLAENSFTEINLLQGYAPTRIVTVAVKDSQGNIVKGADVHFQLYNSAEFCPIAILQSNVQGEASFKTGLGDLVIRAVKNGEWGEMKVASTDSERLELIINQSIQPVESVDFDMVPPPEREGDTSDVISEERIQQHQSIIEEGARLRASYESTFMNEVETTTLAQSMGLPSDRVWDIIRKARGNSREMAAFLQERTLEYGEWPLRLLESLNDKDLIDTFRPTLDDHLIGSLEQCKNLPEDIFIAYVLCPRVLYEMIVPYKLFFQQAFTVEQIETFQSNPDHLVQFIDDTWEIEEDLPNLKGKGTSIGTFQLKVGDQSSIDILFVAICRSLSIPARFHPNEHKPQYWVKGSWNNAVFSKGTVEKTKHAQNGTLRLLRDVTRLTEEQSAAYSVNFTFARLENGLYKTLVYPHGKSDVYDEPFEVEQGSYRLTSGVRLKDGTVRVRLSYFEVLAGACTEIPLTFRQTKQDIPILGKVDRNRTLTSLEGGSLTLGDLVGTHGALVAWLEPEREPSKHFIRELSELQVSFTELGAPVILIIGDHQFTLAFNPDGYPKLPDGAKFIRDSTYEIMPSFIFESLASEAGYPHLLVLDGDDQIRYTASGYKLGAGKEALQILSSVWKS